MKKYKVFKFLVVIAFIFAGVACTSEFEDINTDPDNSNSAPSYNVLVFAVQNSLRDLNDSWIDMSNAACWVQHLAQIQYIDEDKYNFRTNTMNIYWAELYARDADNFNYLIKTAVADATPNMEAIARIMKVWIMQNITDLWGDVPYFDAFNGPDGLYQPAYDSQQAIYADFLTELETANSLWDANADEIPDTDPIYGGDITLWQKFGNSLYLRVLMRMSNVDASTAQTGIEKIMADPATYPIFTSLDDDAELQWPGVAPYEHPYFENAKTRDDHAVSSTLIDYMLNNNDPRISEYAHPAENTGTYVGQPNGQTTNPNLDDVSKIGEFFRDTKDGIQYYMTYEEVLFILAEAALNGWSVGNTAEFYYEAAISASCEKFGIASGDITTFVDRPDVDLAAVADQRAAIGEQKWVALFGQGIQAFHEYRRTGYPVLTPPAAAVYTGHNVPPFRFPYPTDEFTLNGANVTAASSGIDDYMWGVQVWWDTRTGVN